MWLATPSAEGTKGKREGGFAHESEEEDKCVLAKKSGVTDVI